MVAIAILAILQDISINTAALLLLLPIVISWAMNILLHARLNTNFFLLSTKSKLIHLLSNTWFTLPVRRLGMRDQSHKGREITFGCILATVNLVGTIAATYLVIKEPANQDPTGNRILEFLILLLPSLPLYLVGCGLLLLFEKTVHPWHQLGKEREAHCWGKLQGSKKGIQAELTIWEQV